MGSIVAGLVRWPHLVLVWLLRARLVLFTATIVVLALVSSLFYWQTESSVRLSGLVLQILGIGAAAIGIRDTRRMFGKPSFLESVRTWLKAVPGLRPRIVSGAASATLLLSSSGKGHVWHGAGPNPTIESRLSAAEANLDELYNRANAAESAFDAHVRDMKQRLREEMDMRQEADRQLHSKIEAASTDGLHLAAVGAVWLACGVVMSTAPNELLKIF